MTRPFGPAFSDYPLEWIDGGFAVLLQASREEPAP
jgi:hypothetical protein